MAFDFLMEIGCEEIPARLVQTALDQLRQGLEGSLLKNSITYAAVEAFATPRRLILMGRNFSERQPDRTELLTGPPITAAFGPDKQPTAAAVGFASKLQVPVEELKQIATEKGEYLAGEKLIKGRTTEDILQHELPTIIRNLNFPRSMHWEASGFKFIRPIRWILCLTRGNVVPFSVGDVQSSSSTFGHRILDNDSIIEATSLESYRSEIIKHKVIIDATDRLQRIKDCIQTHAAATGGVLVPDDGLLAVVPFLNEFPHVICGEFASDFLKLPREVLTTVMREHQKYFCLEDPSGQLLPKFLAVVDAEPRFSDTIRKGHERVLRARLTDAEFFFKSDLRISLQDRVPKLDQIVFQEKMGTMLEKTTRLVSLCRFVVASLKREDLRDPLERAASLAKADLTTEMVKEFTSLQGVMGGVYAKAQGLPEPVADAIYEHYRPSTLEDDSPASLVGALLSFVDKLDSVVGAFANGLGPTGSRDPLGIRRQAFGFIKVLIEKEISISLEKSFNKSFTLYRSKTNVSRTTAWSEFQSFIKDRLRHVLQEKKFEYDEINSILEIYYDNPLNLLTVISSISSIRKQADFLAVAQSSKRIRNILAKANEDLEAKNVEPSLFEHDSERALHQAALRVGRKSKGATAKGDYESAFLALASMRMPIDRFFDDVLVMAEDPAVRENRLLLLKQIHELFMKLADVSQIVSTRDA